jgi:radical S-adenosyl methionine domain-containing protein 2
MTIRPVTLDARPSTERANPESYSQSPSPRSETSCTPLEIDELVVNWHLTEACNYRCGYCYAAWEREPDQRDVVRDDPATLRLVDALWQFFRPDNAANPLRKSIRWARLRLSIAGGEPMLYPRQVLMIARHAKALGMRVSLITNGSRLPDDEQAMRELALSLDILGLSLDAFSEQRNQAIGRADSKGQCLSLPDLARKVAIARLARPDLAVKINTVVNAINVHDDLRLSLAQLRPNRWKVLRMLPVTGEDLIVSDQDFAAFVARHASMGACMSVEDNQDMVETYIMVDPQGRFFQNGSGRIGLYRYSKPITAQNVELAFSGMRFSAAGFAARYQANSLREHRLSA